MASSIIYIPDRWLVFIQPYGDIVQWYMYMYMHYSSSFNMTRITLTVTE